MKIFQIKNGYHYNSDTLVLYDFISSFLRPNFSGKVLDVGCGSGILGLLIKRDFSNISLNLLDILPENLELSKLNLAQNNLEAGLILSDFAKFKSQDRFDLIISNPPYYHSGVKMSKNPFLAVSRYQEALSLGDFIRVANSHLTPSGELIFCYESGEISRVLATLSEFKLSCLAIKFVYARGDKEANLALFRAKKNSRSNCKILPPLFLKNGNDDSDEARAIYKKSDTKSEFC